MERRNQGVLKEIEVDEKEWYEEACRSRPGWRTLRQLGLESTAEMRAVAQAQGQATREVMCEVCSRTFRRESDKKRHKCSSERQKPYGNSKEPPSSWCAIDGS